RVQRRRFVALGVHEDQLIFHLAVLHAVVQSRQLRQVDTGLTGPEERLLPLLDRLALVHGDVHHPAHVLRVFHLRERDDHLLLQVVLGQLRVEAPQEGGVLGRVPLPQPEDRFLPYFRGGVRALGVHTENVGGFPRQQTVGSLAAHIVVIVVAQAALGARAVRPGRRLCVRADPAVRFLVALLGERRLDAREQRVSVPQRRRFGIAPLLGDEQAARAAQVVVLVERERGPIEGVTRARRVGIAAGKI